MTTLTQERLKEVLSYDEAAGVFVWLVDKSMNAKKGMVAGCAARPDGSRTLCIDNVTYPESKLAILYCHGTMPSSPVFHSDKDAGNSAIANLSLTAPPPRKAKPRNKLTQPQLLELLTYCPDTGIWTWNEDRGNSIPEGSRAGSIDDKGNRRIRCHNVLYCASRLAYLYMTGKFPSGRVFREDGDPSNDRYDNLTTINPRKVSKKVPKDQQDQLDAAGWKEICKGAEPPPPLITEVEGGVVNRTAQWVWFEATKPDDCLMPPNEEVERTNVAKEATFDSIFKKIREVLG